MRCAQLSEWLVGATALALLTTGASAAPPRHSEGTSSASSADDRPKLKEAPLPKLAKSHALDTRRSSSETMAVSEAEKFEPADQRGKDERSVESYEPKVNGRSSVTPCGQS